jgi:hypothetical protein
MIIGQNCDCNKMTGLHLIPLLPLHFFYFFSFYIKTYLVTLHPRRRLCKFPVAVIKLNHKIVSRLPTMKWKDSLIYEFINQIISLKWILQPEILWWLNWREKVFSSPCVKRILFSWSGFGNDGRRHMRDPCTVRWYVHNTQILPFLGKGGEFLPICTQTQEFEFPGEDAGSNCVPW